MAVAVVLAGCALQPELVIHNRSARDIAFLPGVVVAACSSVSLTGPELDQAQEEFNREFFEEDGPFGWVPPGRSTSQRPAWRSDR